jgi:hypothetical protein
MEKAFMNYKYTLNSNLPLELGSINKIILIGFPNRLLKND